MHDRRKLAVVLAAVEPVADRLDQPRDGLLPPTVSVLKIDLRAGVGAVDALKVDRPLLLPGKTLVGELRDVGHRLADRRRLLADTCCRH